MHLLSHQEVYVRHLKQEDIQHGIVPHRHLYVRMQQVQHFVFQQHSVPTQVRHLDQKTPLLRSMAAINEQSLTSLKIIRKYHI